VLPLLPRLPAQLIHNDFNPHNILVDANDETSVVGVIDFGDMVRATRVQDLATAAAYHLCSGPSALAGAWDIVAAYHDGSPLTAEEIEILPDLMGARLSLSIAISSWRAIRHPANASYIMRNQSRVWDGLAGLGALDRAEVLATLRNACRMG
jgi:hydroxylysine kinase